MDENHLQQPLLPSPNHTSTTETSAISTRLLVILLIGIISIWANHEASKGFKITVINNTNIPAGEKFSLFYVSNDEATRLVQNSFNFAANILFPGDDSILEKLVDQIDVQLANSNFTNDSIISMKLYGEKSKYVLYINPLVMEFADFKYRIRRVIQKGIAEIMLFHQQLRAPKTLLDGMVEYVSELAGYDGPNPRIESSRNSGGRCWEDKDPRMVAKFLAYGEGKSEGFVGRMNQEMNIDGWYEGIMDKVLGIPAIHLCASFHDSMIET